jgi:shikimate 5-dehydrogenase
LYIASEPTVLFLIVCPKDRAKSLACAVSGEARPFEDIVNFQPNKGAILANATPLGMHPNTDRIPVSEVYTLSLLEQIEQHPCFGFRH